MLRSLIHLEFSFVEGDKYEFIYILLPDAMHLTRPIFEDVANMVISMESPKIIWNMIYHKIQLFHS